MVLFGAFSVLCSEACRNMEPLSSSDASNDALMIAALNQDLVEPFKVYLDSRSYNFAIPSLEIFSLFNIISMNDSVKCLLALLESEELSEVSLRCLFYSCCSHNSTKCVEALFFRLEPTTICANALEISLNKGHILLVQDLLFKTRAHLATDVLERLLRTACSKGYHEVVQVLLESGADPSFDNSICLYEACRGDHEQVVELLFKDGRVDPSSSNSFITNTIFQTSNTRLKLLFLMYNKTCFPVNYFATLVQQASRLNQSYEHILSNIRLMTQFPHKLPNFHVPPNLISSFCKDDHLLGLVVKFLDTSEDSPLVRHMKKGNFHVVPFYLSTNPTDISVLCSLMKKARKLGNDSVLRMIVDYSHSLTPSFQHQILDSGLRSFSLDPSFGYLLSALLSNEVSVDPNLVNVNRIIQALHRYMLLRHSYEYHYLPIEIQQSIFIALLQLNK